MICPSCKAKNTSKVIESIPTKYGTYRRRKCLACKHRFSTNERAVPDNPKVRSQLA